MKTWEHLLVWVTIAVLLFSCDGSDRNFQEIDAEGFGWQARSLGFTVHENDSPNMGPAES